MNRLQIRGAIYGLIAASIGCVLFALIGSAILAVQLGITYNFVVVISLFLIGILISLIPACLGGIWLTNKFISQHRSNDLSRKSALQKGLLLGAAVGFALAILVYILIPEKLSTTIFLWLVFLATAIASVGGGWTGSQVSSHILGEGNAQNLPLP